MNKKAYRAADCDLNFRNRLFEQIGLNAQPNNPIKHAEPMFQHRCQRGTARNG